MGEATTTTPANGRLEKFEAAFAEVLETPVRAAAVSSLTASAAAFAAAALARRPPPQGARLVVAVTDGVPEADALLADLRALAPESGVRAAEFMPEMADDQTAAAARLKTALAVRDFGESAAPLIVAAPVAALNVELPDVAAIAAAAVEIKTGETPRGGFAALAASLAAAGYERGPEVAAPGTFAVRGGVLDAWSPDAELPVRAEFFGDEVESVRAFDPSTQISTARLDRAEFAPVRISAAGTTTLAALLPRGCTFLMLEHNAYAAPDPGEKCARIIYTGDPAPAGVPTLHFQTSPLPGFAELGAESARSPELIDAARARLKKHLDAAAARGALVTEDAALGGGFEVPGLVVVTRSDRSFSHRRAAPAAPRRGAGERLGSAPDLDAGDLVVHVEYGIGRFMGSTEVEVDGRKSEALEVEYADGGKVYVPVAHAHLLSRYVGVKGEQVRLDSLDGKRWGKAKREAQKAVRDLAASLLETQARRAMVEGFACDVSFPEMAAFEAAFPYEATPDQEEAIGAVLADMASKRPMDRLICGDAGYGKTEVAMRAAYVAAMNGRQTALIAPTTVLAEQHYETFLARFEGTPVRIEALSRFHTPAEMRGARARLASGAADIVVGTHAVLSRTVKFKNLGLVIIDEEQRFGVRDKEKLKRLRATADVLAMSATPIPRTLYMAMTGARELSTLRTPPRERVSAETKIVRGTDETVRAAIERELARAGQVYFLHNRVGMIESAAERVRRLAPRARVGVAHGRLPAAELAARMQTFSRGGYDVLVCTTIVESGLDIPRANTILVDRADCYGIAALYQLRGRVGRSARQGYAYFLLPESGSVDAEARERLDALKKHSGLGAGFNIALKDLEIRGAGNLLGREQSGHIAAVGFRLYCQLLRRTMAQLKGERAPEIVDVTLNLDFIDFSPATVDGEECGACLPYSYVEDEAQRMEFHRRIAETMDAKGVRLLKRELADRYGRLPAAALRLVKLAEFRVACAGAGIRRIDVRGERAFFYRAGEQGVAFVRRLSAATADGKLAELAKAALARL